MTDDRSADREIGKARLRVEDNRLLRGVGRYASDLARTGALHTAFVRSPLPHARIARIDVEAARRAPGVAIVLTAADLPSVAAPTPAPARPHPGAVRESAQTAPPSADFLAAPQPILVGDVARHVGVPVVAVVAETRAQAVDAAALVEIEWEELPAVAGVEAAVRPEAPLVHPEFGSNVAWTTRRGTSSDQIEALLAASAHRIRMRLPINRLAGAPMESIAILAAPQPAAEGMTVWVTTQAPWRVRTVVAKSLGLDEADVRAIAPEVGGGFGVRGPVYSEYLAVAHAAHRLGRPVGYSATRSEDMLITRGSRDMVVDAELGADADGRLKAIKATVLHDLGAYADAAGTAMTILSCLNGAYVVEGVAAELRCIYTNTSPTGPYRGAGRPEGAYVVERLIEALADRLGVDPAEMRRRNFVASDCFPYKTPLGPTYDSGDYATALDRALAWIDYQGLRRRQAELRAEGARDLLGIGIVSYVEPAGGGWESGHVRVDPAGRILVHSGSSAHGQGHQTTFAQIIADRLGVPFEWVAIRQGDTGSGPPGIGTFGSRSTMLGGSAISLAAERVLEKARQIAANLLEAAPEDVVAADGALMVAGAPSRRVPWARVAAAAYGGGLPPGMELGLEATSYFQIAEAAWSFGTCVVAVRVDRETGEVAIARLVSVDDCGTIVNPTLLEGQAHGGLAQGIGATMVEWMQYDDAGRPLSPTFMDYAMPLASELPTFELGHTVTPAPGNPLGVKGHGEAGTIAAPPALVAAVLDALRPLGVASIDPPLTPERVWQAIRSAAPAT
jgi:carbon-monoxide dehydrogenase large subunit